jgi:hypothetical protein
MSAGDERAREEPRMRVAEARSSFREGFIGVRGSVNY